MQFGQSSSAILFSDVPGTLHVHTKGDTELWDGDRGERRIGKHCSQEIPSLMLWKFNLTARVLPRRTLWRTWRPGRWPQKEEHAQMLCATFLRKAQQVGCNHSIRSEQRGRCPTLEQHTDPFPGCTAEENPLCRKKKEITSVFVSSSLFTKENWFTHFFTSILASTASGGALYFWSFALYTSSGFQKKPVRSSMRDEQTNALPGAEEKREMMQGKSLFPPWFPELELDRNPRSFTISSRNCANGSARP